MAKIIPFPASTRPAPPPDMGLDAFAPDQDGLGEWVRETFLDEDGPLFNERHMHLREAPIGWLWTTAVATNHDRQVAGQCKLVGPMSSKWSSAMAHFQLRQWFGYVPDILITISALHARQADDWAFCALIEHELYHVGQATDMYDMPRFNRDGYPILEMRAHDVEEFTDVVARYGAQATGVADMVRVANNGPTVGEARMRLACGTCMTARRA